jgi:peptide/nickel transport system permease protein
MSMQPKVILSYGLRSLGSLILTLFGLSIVTFIVGRVVPIDPVLAVVGDRASAETYARAQQEMGLDQPLVVQFGRYIRGILQGDFGVSTVTSRPVLQDLIEVFPATLELSAFAMLIGVCFGVPLGVAAAVWRGRWQDQLVRAISLVGYSMPVFWLGLVGLLLFYAKLGWVGGPGRIDLAYDGLVEPQTRLLLIDSLLQGDFDVFRNAFHHIVLPAVILGYLPLAFIARMTRSFMIEQLRQEYVLAAQAKGLRSWQVIWVHAFGNILVPLATVLGLTFGSLLEGAVLTETVFAWPGLGLYMKNSLFNGDLNAVIGGTLLIGVTYMMLNMITDLAQPLLDPRVAGRN